MASADYGYCLGVRRLTRETGPAAALPGENGGMATRTREGKGGNKVPAHRAQPPKAIRMEASSKRKQRLFIVF